MRGVWRRRATVIVSAGLLVFVLWVVAPIGRPAPSTQNSPLPSGDIPVPTGGVAVFYGPQYCCDLITVSPSGDVTFELGTLRWPGSETPTWQRYSGVQPTASRWTVDEAERFIAEAEAIGATPAPIGEVEVHPAFERPTVWGAIRSGTVHYGSYPVDLNPYFESLGQPLPQTEQVMPAATPFPPVPANATAFILDEGFYVVHTSGEVTVQFGVGGERAIPGYGVGSLVYRVRPISRLLAWKIHVLAPLLYVPPGCPGLDHANSYRYLVVVQGAATSNGLFCHAWSPLRDDLMSIAG